MITQIQSDSLADIAQARAEIYKLLAEVYCRPPSTPLLDALKKWAVSLAPETEYLESLSPELKESLAEINRFFQEKPDPPVEDLSIEFTRLFRGVKQLFSPPPPYESVYREEAGHVYGESTVSVHRIYQKFGLETATELGGEPPDHISLELEFMHFLCRQEAVLLREGKEEESENLAVAQKEFMESHLMAWAPGWCQEIRKQERLGLFRGIADLTESWLAFDYEQHLKNCDQ